jgi:hypothetical protein
MAGRRSSKSKNIDRQMELLKKDFLVVKRGKAGEKKSFAAGKFAAGSGSQQMWSSVLSYLAAIFIFGGKNKAQTKKMLEHVFPNDVDRERLVEELLSEVHLNIMISESKQLGMDEIEEGIYEDILIEFEPILIEMQSFIDEFDLPESGRLTVSILNEEIQNIKGGKAASNKVVKETPKQKQAKRFWKFFTLFQNKLAEFSIVEDENIAKFLVTLTNMVRRIQIKGKAEVSHG